MGVWVQGVLLQIILPKASLLLPVRLVLGSVTVQVDPPNLLLWTSLVTRVLLSPALFTLVSALSITNIKFSFCIEGQALYF